MAQEKKILGLLMLLGLMALSACNPCYTLAEGLCNCYESPQEKATCIAGIGLAKQHQGYKWVTDENICREAIKANACECPKFLAKEYDKCGLYRPVGK